MSLHPRNDVNKIYILRKEGERRLTSIEDSVDASIQQFENYMEKHKGGLITAIRNETSITIDSRMAINSIQKREEKQLYGRFKRLINNISYGKTGMWLKKGNFKREIESLHNSSTKQRHKNQSYKSENR